jgi:hypothetical protein
VPDTTGCGIAFKLSPPGSPGKPWTETILYRFRGEGYGGYPTSAIVPGDDGTYYGATAGGGALDCETRGLAECGTVFMLIPPDTPGGAWTETVLADSLSLTPDGDLVPYRGWLYGVTSGSPGPWCPPCAHGPGNSGTVFRVAPPALLRGSRLETLFTFGPYYPVPGGLQAGGGLLVAEGVVFGTTSLGRLRGCGVEGCGTVFQLTEPAQPDGAWGIEYVHTFRGRSGRDGNYPVGELVAGKGGVIFGTTALGGSGPCTSANGDGCGTVWQLTPPAGTGEAWREEVLYDFQNGEDGANPSGLSAGADGELFGSTTGGNGTIFEIIP